MDNKILRNYLNNGIMYKNKVYSLFNLPELFEDDMEIEYIMDEKSLPFLLGTSFSYEETDESIIFQCYDVFADIKSDELDIFANKVNEIIFDKKTQKATGEKIEELFLQFLNYDSKILLNQAIDKVIKTNENVFNFLKDNASKFRDLIGSEIAYHNFINICIFNLLEFEKLINSKNTKLLETNLCKEHFELNEANKLHQVVGLPKFAITLIKKNKLEEYIDKLRDISSLLDGNSFKIFLEFLGNSKLLIDYSLKAFYSASIEEFLKNIEFFIKKDYRIIDLLNYLLKQSMFYNDKRRFYFPFIEANLLRDYIQMCENFGLKYDKYPSMLSKTHDITAKNINILQESSIEFEDEFEGATIKYCEVEMDIEVTDPKDAKKKKTYKFIVPSSIKDLIEEGNNLHHCVGSYANKVINGECHIVFMREAENPNISLITIDIDKDYKLVEAKKNFNEEPENEYYKIINKWLEEVKRKVK